MRPATGQVGELYRRKRIPQAEKRRLGSEIEQIRLPYRRRENARCQAPLGNAGLRSFASRAIRRSGKRGFHQSVTKHSLVTREWLLGVFVGRMKTLESKE